MANLVEMLKDPVLKKRLRSKAEAEMGVYPNSYISVSGGIVQIASVGFFALSSDKGEARVSYYRVDKLPEGSNVKTAPSQFSAFGARFNVVYGQIEKPIIGQVNYADYKGRSGPNTTVSKH